MAELPELIEDLSAFSVRTSRLGDQAARFRFAAGEAWRAGAARRLDIPEVRRLEGELEVRRWRDGVEVRGRFSGEAVQTCGISLEPLEEEVSGAFEVRLLPEESLRGEEGAEIVIDPLGEDPPELLEGDEIDLGGLVFEHFALELDPFPRKPGVTFEPPEDTPIASPFAVLKPRIS